MVALSVPASMMREAQKVDQLETFSTALLNQFMPSYVGIDPYNKLIDRNSDDHVEQVDEVTVQFRR